MSRSSIGVVFGGRSVEHDVSVITAHQVMAQLRIRHEVVPVYVTREGRWLTGAALDDLGVYRARRWSEAGEDCYLPPVPGAGGLVVPGGRLRKARTIPLDAVIPAIHGTNGEDGTLQGVLELAAIPYAGSGVVASAVGMDKVQMKAAFAAAGLPTVPHSLVETALLDEDPDRVLGDVEESVGYPCFVKPSRLGSSVGIGRAGDRAALRSALEVARRYDHRVLVEPSMEGCAEINCSVLGGAGSEPRASVCEQPVGAHGFLRFEDKYLGGGKDGSAAAGAGKGMVSQDRLIPAPISAAAAGRVQADAVRAFRAIGASGVARIDSFLREETGESWVMEINTVPGSFSFYLWEASGLAFGDLLEELLTIARAEHEARAELMVTFESGILERTGGPKRG